MRRLAFTLLFLATLAALILAPSAISAPCYECQVDIGYGGVMNDWCTEEFGAPAKWCTQTWQLVPCNDPNVAGPCREVACHLHEMCDISSLSPLMYGQPVKAAYVMADIAEIRKVQRGGGGR